MKVIDAIIFFGAMIASGIALIITGPAAHGYEHGAVFFGFVVVVSAGAGKACLEMKKYLT